MLSTDKELVFEATPVMLNGLFEQLTILILPGDSSKAP